ncbi:MAG: class II fumarate hydratase [Deltaproteobacteria bacterium]|nr:MAG: class II fumarate hydratase [Deltaproteobacteria bacterium]
MEKDSVREEKDSLGTILVPGNAYFGAGTQRAVENFPISGVGMPNSFIHALALIKKCASVANQELGLLDHKIADAITNASQEVLDGKFDDQFVVDIFQTGSGTSTNMNMNEVIASRSNEQITGQKGGKKPVHPNDHVNLGQSSNDVIPSAIHIAAGLGIKEDLIPSLFILHQSLAEKAEAFSDVLKIGRTHLQDAVPMYLGQEFSGYARQIELGIKRIQTTGKELEELALGGTAIGNGINTHPEFAGIAIGLISRHTGIPFKEATNHFEAQGAKDAIVSVSGALKTVAISLAKIANDIRFLASGPRCGLGEITLPATQPGSSIIPGKVNPVIPEAVIQVAAQVMGNDTTIMLCGHGGYFELNTMMPLMAHTVLYSIRLLAASTRIFAEKCVNNLTANRLTCAAYIEKSLALATYLVPEIGYDRSAEIAKIAYETGKTIQEVVVEKQLLPDKKIAEIFQNIQPGN